MLSLLWKVSDDTRSKLFHVSNRNKFLISMVKFLCWIERVTTNFSKSTGVSSSPFKCSVRQLCVQIALKSMESTFNISLFLFLPHYFTQHDVFFIHFEPKWFSEMKRDNWRGRKTRCFCSEAPRQKFACSLTWRYLRSEKAIQRELQGKKTSVKHSKTPRRVLTGFWNLWQTESPQSHTRQDRECFHKIRRDTLCLTFVKKGTSSAELLNLFSKMFDVLFSRWSRHFPWFLRVLRRYVSHFTCWPDTVVCVCVERQWQSQHGGKWARFGLVFVSFDPQGVVFRGVPLNDISAWQTSTVFDFEICKERKKNGILSKSTKTLKLPLLMNCAACWCFCVHGSCKFCENKRLQKRKSCSSAPSLKIFPQLNSGKEMPMPIILYSCSYLTERKS